MYLVVDFDDEKKAFPVLKEYKDGSYMTILGKVRESNKMLFVKHKKYGNMRLKGWIQRD